MHLPVPGVLIIVIGAISGCSEMVDASKISKVKPALTESGLYCAEPIWNLGEVNVAGGTVEFPHTFRLENHSKLPIKLKEIASSCGCLVAKTYPRTIAPGAHADLPVTLSVFGPPGGIDRVILVTEESPSKGQIALRTIGSRAVSDLLKSNPGKLNFGVISRGESRTTTLTLRRYDGSPVAWSGILSESKSLSLAGQVVASRGIDHLQRQIERVEVPISLSTEFLPNGVFKSKITLKTNSANKNTSELNVEVEAIVSEAPMAWVDSIFISELPAGDSKNISIVKPLVKDQFPKVKALSYRGDDAIGIEFLPGDVGDVHPRVKVSRTRSATVGKLARGVLSVKAMTVNGESVSEIPIVVFFPN